jgi:integrase
MPGRDTRTRWQGVFARHRQGCPVEDLPTGSALTDVARVCSCEPSYYAKVYDRARRRHVATRRYAASAAARNARKDLLAVIDRGELPRQASPRLRDATAQFIAAAGDGRALNKHGRPYKESSWRDIEECLTKHVVPRLGPRRLGEIKRLDIQLLVDDLGPKLSGSRVRSIVNAIRSLYRWAEDHEMVSEDPAARVRLPAMAETRRDRIATPREFAELLGALKLADALPYALAGYGMGRRAQIQRLRWREVDLELGLIEWGAESEARKSISAQRVVPTVQPLLALLELSRDEAGGAEPESLVCPPRRAAELGLLHTGGLTTRVEKAWKAKGLTPIGLHECRHTAATWLDAAGVSPKVASVLMGHATPDRQPGAAEITLARYTHVMPDAIEVARVQLDAWLEAQMSD